MQDFGVIVIVDESTRLLQPPRTLKLSSTSNTNAMVECLESLDFMANDNNNNHFGWVRRAVEAPVEVSTCAKHAYTLGTAPKLLRFADQFNGSPKFCAARDARDGAFWCQRPRSTKRWFDIFCTIFEFNREAWSVRSTVYFYINFLLKLHDDSTEGGTFSLLLFIFSIFRIRWCTVQITHYLFLSIIAQPPTLYVLSPTAT